MTPGTRLRAPIAPRLDDADAERVRRSHEEKIQELQSLPASSMQIIPGVVLADGIATPIAHRLGRAPVWIGESTVRGPSSTGRIEEIRDSTHDRANVVVLKASGFGAAITIDLAVL